jgi:DNA replication protein DnaC
MSTPQVLEPPNLAADIKAIGLPAVSQHWERLAAEATRKRQSHPEYLADLLHLETQQRRERRTARRIKDARFPVLKTLDSFRFEEQPTLDRDAVLELFQAGFVETRSNVVLVGGVGTGKSHLAIALGIACCQRECRVRYVTAAELTTALVEARAEGRLSRKIEHFARFDVVVLDELGYVPFDKQGGDLLFDFITRVYERRSLIVTTNLPFGRWGEVFHDATSAAAVIDRVVHHATVLKTDGESYRLKDARRAASRRGRREGTPA